jgi:hypothetical protein
MRRVMVFVVATAFMGYVSLFGQATTLSLKQARDNTLPEPLTSADRATLGDPLFNLLLATKANTVTLSAVTDAIQPDAANRHLFVVSEDIVESAPTGSRRAVVAFDGSNGDETLTGNVMLSLSFGPGGVAEGSDIEAWGWDSHRGRYNYYKLDSKGSSAGIRTWKFRGSSVDADLLAPTERQQSCLACHIAGEPVMKELLFPWNNWHAGVGGSFKAEYLDPASAAPNKWPAAKTPFFQRLSTADKLETGFLIPSLRRFNTTRLNRMLKRDEATGNRSITTEGRLTVLEGRRLLRPLFEPVAVNLLSSRNTSGNHPFGSASDFVPTLNIQVPGSFFLNTHLIAGGGGPGHNGLKITEANQFGKFATLTQQESKELGAQFKVLFNGVLGDTHFSWFMPDTAFVDNDIIDQAMRLGAVTPHFVAAALAVDHETPLFSLRRLELLQFLPDRFEFTPLDGNTDPTTLPRNVAADLLTQAVIAKINEAKPASGTPADEFRTLLVSPDAVAELRRKVVDYVARVRSALGSANPAERRKELTRLYTQLIERRRRMLAHPALGRLDETHGQLLLPMPIK